MANVTFPGWMQQQLDALNTARPAPQGNGYGRFGTGPAQPPTNGSMGGGTDVALPPTGLLSGGPPQPGNMGAPRPPMNPQFANATQPTAGMRATDYMAMRQRNAQQEQGALPNAQQIGQRFNSLPS